mgnify:FL=1
MTIPILTFKAEYKRVYKKYSLYLISQVVKIFLFNKINYRDMDSNIFDLSGNRNRGFESWAILNYLGLNDSFKGFFEDYDLYQVIEFLKNDYQDFDLTIFHLNYQTKLEDERIDFQQKIESAQALNLNERLEQITKSANVMPKLKKEIIFSYSRNPNIVAQALFRAQGKCEKCGKNAPFRRKSNGTPYLEVHHKIPLSEQINNDSNL